MDAKLLVASTQGLIIGEREHDRWREVQRVLADQHVTAVVVRGDVILAGTLQGMMRSDDRGTTWHDANTGLTDPYVRWLAYHPTVANLVFAGTEPANIFISHDGGQSWRGCPEVAHLRDENGWFLPYSPGAGCVRSFTFHGERIYAAVEVGGVLRSDDCGETWRLVEGSSGKPSFRDPVPRTFICPDVHEVAVHPETADVVFAATMAGLYRTTDGGRKWLHLYADCYIRSVVLDPADPEHLIIGPADDVAINGQIEESHNGGYSWTTATVGLQTPWRRNVVERLTRVGDELMAVAGGGELFTAPLATLHWQRILPDEPYITGVALLTAS